MTFVEGAFILWFVCRELAFFFPTFAVPTIESKTKKKQIQRTLALIRPDALAAKKGLCCYIVTQNMFLINPRYVYETVH